jgi:transcriptional regulator of acetoin/glycerol metabolism
VYIDRVEELDAGGQQHWSDWLAKAEASGFRAGLRIIASTTDHLLSRVREGSFDKRLGSLLLRFVVELPPLRDRSEDIPAIADALTQQLSRSVGRRIRLSHAARDHLALRRWPGNVRQLERILERAIAFSRGRQIRRQLVEELCADDERTLSAIRQQHAHRERDELILAVEATGGNISRAAERLGRSRSSVYRLLEKHGIDFRQRR